MSFLQNFVFLNFPCPHPVLSISVYLWSGMVLSCNMLPCCLMVHSFQHLLKPSMSINSCTYVTPAHLPVQAKVDLSFIYQHCSPFFECQILDFLMGFPVLTEAIRRNWRENHVFVLPSRWSMNRAD